MTVASIPFLSPLAILAQAQPPAPSMGDQLLGFLPFILLIAAMWFLLIAPQRKRQKEHQKLVSGLQKGDEVMTASGIYGTITNVKDDRVTVRIDDGNSTKVDVNRQFVQTVLNRTAAETK